MAAVINRALADLKKNKASDHVKNEPPRTVRGKGWMYGLPFTP
jgi:hypothetical protein